jgi:hypothetical protein
MGISIVFSYHAHSSIGKRARPFPFCRATETGGIVLGLKNLACRISLDAFSNEKDKNSLRFPKMLGRRLRILVCT